MILGQKHSQETKQKIRLKALGNKRWLGKRHTEEAKKKIGQSKKGVPNMKRRNELNNNWKGDGASKVALHVWVKLRFVKPKACMKCGIIKSALDLSNKSQKYKRELSDWWYLCRSCHWKYDGQHKGDKSYMWGKHRSQAEKDMISLKMKKWWSGQSLERKAEHKSKCIQAAKSRLRNLEGRFL